MEFLFPIIIIVMALLILSIIISSKRQHRPQKRRTNNAIDDYLFEVAEPTKSPNKRYSLHKIEGAKNEHKILRCFLKGVFLWEKDYPPCNFELVIDDNGLAAIFVEIFDTKTTRLYVINPTGQILKQHFFKKGCSRVGLSYCNKFVWFELFGERGPGEKDYFYLFNCDHPDKITRLASPSYELYYLRGIVGVNSHPKYLQITYEDNFTVMVDYSGNILNKDELEKAYQESLENSTNGYTLYNLASGILMNHDYQELSPQEKSRVDSILMRANNGDVSKNTHASIYKYRGEHALINGDKNHAITMFEKALEYNPKIGLKRKVVELKKQR